MIIKSADNKDKKELLSYFRHYKNADMIKKRVECYMKHNFTILAKEDSQIVGMLQWYVKEDPNAGVAEFEEIFVNEKFRGRRVGSKLVEFAIKNVVEFFKSINIRSRKIFLFVSKDNIPAKRLYEKYGFKFIAELNDLFSDNKKEVFYSLDLNG